MGLRLNWETDVHIRHAAVIALVRTGRIYVGQLLRTDLYSGVIRNKSALSKEL